MSGDSARRYDSRVDDLTGIDFASYLSAVIRENS